ncbi:MAG: hypothetical protein AAF320_04195 [Myxococcota bacterium]
MNKVKLLVGCGSLAFAMFATGCANDACADITEEQKCNDTTSDKNNKACAWNTETKKCQEKGATTAGDGSGSGITQEAFDAEKERADAAEAKLKEAGTGGTGGELDETCGPKQDIDLDEVCMKLVADTVTDEGDRQKACEDTGADGNNKKKVCEYKAVGKCALSPSICILNATTKNDGANDWAAGAAGSAFAAAAFTHVVVGPAGGTADQQACTAHITVNAAIAANDPCLAFKEKALCQAGKIKMKEVGGSLLNAGNNTIDNLVGFCQWDGGAEKMGMCDIKKDEFKKGFECDKITTKDDCEKAKTVCTWGKHGKIKAAAAPAPTT